MMRQNQFDVNNNTIYLFIYPLENKMYHKQTFK